MARKETALRQQQDDLAKARETFEDQFAARLQAERASIAATEAKKAREAVAADLQTKSKQLIELQQLLDQNIAKLAEAQKAQAEVLKKQRELDAKMREVDFTVERRVQESVGAE